MSSRTRQELVIANRLSELAAVERWLAALMTDWAVPPKASFAVDLVLNEAVTNVISHAFSDGTSHAIRIALTDTQESVKIEIEDDGRPFDPLSAPAMAAPTDLEHASVGGRGIHLLRSYSDEQHYAYSSGLNRLSLVVKKSN